MQQRAKAEVKPTTHLAIVSHRKESLLSYQLLDWMSAHVCKSDKETLATFSLRKLGEQI